jgi:hypothetical protein
MGRRPLEENRNATRGGFVFLCRFCCQMWHRLRLLAKRPAKPRPGFLTSLTSQGAAADLVLLRNVRAARPAALGLRARGRRPSPRQPAQARDRHRRPHAAVVMRAAKRPSGSARQQPQETEGPSSSLLPSRRPSGAAIADQGPVGGAAARTSRSGRQQPLETGEPFTHLLPRTGPRVPRFADRGPVGAAVDLRSAVRAHDLRLRNPRAGRAARNWWRSPRPPRGYQRADPDPRQAARITMPARGEPAAWWVAAPRPRAESG